MCLPAPGGEWAAGRGEGAGAGVGAPVIVAADGALDADEAVLLQREKGGEEGKGEKGEGERGGVRAGEETGGGRGRAAEEGGRRKRAGGCVAGSPWSA